MGTSITDLNCPIPITITDPDGWFAIDLRDSKLNPTRTFVIVAEIVQNHQNGRDTHIRFVIFNFL